MLRVITGGRQISDYIVDSIANVSAAYSLRKLRSAYAGSAIRVRRSSDNSEQDIGFVNGILDTASLATFVGANDGFITKWYDQTTNGFDTIQASASLQPYIVLAGVIYTLANGTPTLYSPTGKQLRYSSASNITKGSYSVVVTYGTNDNQATFSDYSAIAGGASPPDGTGENCDIQGSNGGTTMYPASGSCNFYVNNKLTTTLLPTTSQGKILSADASSTNNTIPSPVNGALSIFSESQPGNRFWIGKISELIFTSTRLGTQERSLITSNQAKFYGINLS